ncbi:MAG TPA: response regulator [Oceanobacillus sp.]|nr:response regulator [Oceanobacillus sp.]
MALKHDPPLVLVADDEVNTTIMLQHIFERDGYRVERVTNGVAALDAAKNLLPDLILLDILMPGLNGFEVLRKLREDEETATIPTIMITANAREPADVARGMKLGADDYLYKPFAPQELLARAQSKIKARQLEDALHRRSKELEVLLNASEKLNQYLELSELPDVILDLLLNLLPGDFAAIQRVDEHGETADIRVMPSENGREREQFLNNGIALRILSAKRTLLWPGDTPILPEYQSGLATPLQHGGYIVGVLILASNSIIYEDAHLRLFEGLARQASLALRNAQLYEIQANYALHLEDMVAERTSELESAQKLLIRSEKLASIGHLAASIAHEINNPLMPIRNLLDEIVEDLEQNQVQFDYKAIKIIQESLERIRGIVSRLLEFARDTGPDMQLLDVSTLLEGIITLNRKFFQHARIEVEADLPPLPSIYGSKDQLDQVFMNLALNAQAAMENGGKLVISARAEGEHVVVEFTDTGCGIPPEAIDKIFDPFYSTKPNGTGLGLFVSHGIIQGHHGTIEVRSVENQGTTFTIRLPIHTPINQQQ